MAGDSQSDSETIGNRDISSANEREDGLDIQYSHEDNVHNGRVVKREHWKETG